jgi:hypothetical protein
LKAVVGTKLTKKNALVIKFSMVKLIILISWSSPKISLGTIRTRIKSTSSMDCFSLVFPWDISSRPGLPLKVFSGVLYGLCVSLSPLFSADELQIS